MGLKIKQIKPWRIYHVTHERQYDLCMTFVRMQEFYESASSKFRGKEFTLEEYMDWYAQKYGHFTYTKDWSGFNIPSHIINKFYHVNWIDMRPREEYLFKLLSNQGIEVGQEEQPHYYIIGTVKNSLDYFIHELVHGWFYLLPEYRKDVLKAIKQYKLTELRRILISRGYAKTVLLDEIHAYVLTGLTSDMEETDEIRELRKVLYEIVHTHLGKNSYV